MYSLYPSVCIAMLGCSNFFFWHLSALRSKNSKWVGLCTEINIGKWLEKNQCACTQFPDSLSLTHWQWCSLLGGEGQLNIEDVYNQVMPVVKGGAAPKRIRDSDSFCWFGESLMLPGCVFYGHLFPVMGKMEFVSRGLILSHLGKLRLGLKKMKQLSFKKTSVIISRCLSSGYRA